MAKETAPQSFPPGDEPFGLLVESVSDYAIVMLDPEGRVVTWNRGAERLVGYSRAEIIGRHASVCYTPEGIAGEAPAHGLRQAEGQGRFEDEGWRVRRDGSRFRANVVITAMRDAAQALVGYAMVMRDVSDRKHLEALEEQGRQLTEFMAMLAHELRNPLAPIRNATSIMAVSKETSPQIAWCREVIERQTSQLSRIVDDLLDVSRITRGQLAMKAEPMDLNVAAQRAIEASRPLIASRKHHLDVAIRAEAIPIHGDLTRITQVVANLLGNAAKYTAPGGRISLEVTTEGDRCVVRVRDNGGGIPPDLLGRVFDLFVQGERSLDRTEGGLGIGLTLARRIVDMHGGRLTAASAGAGQGSEFVVSLPRLSLRFTEPVDAGTAALDPAAVKRSILVVDDNVDSTSSLAMLLSLLGHDVATEHHGAAALERIRQQRPDLVFLDIGLPGMDGYEVARRVRELPEGRGMRIFAMTGYGQDEDRRKSFEAGFDGHLVKPVSAADLKAVLDGP